MTLPEPHTKTLPHLYIFGEDGSKILSWAKVYTAFAAGVNFKGVNLNPGITAKNDPTLIPSGVSQRKLGAFPRRG